MGEILNFECSRLRSAHADAGILALLSLALCSGAEAASKPAALVQ